MATPHEQVQLTHAIGKLSSLADDMAEVKSTMQRLTDAVTRLAVMEERQIADRAGLDRAFKELEKHDGRIKALEQAQPLQQQSSKWVLQAMGLLLAAVVGAVSTGALRLSHERAPQAQIGQP